MIAATTIARSLFAIALLSGATVDSAPAAPNNAPTRQAPAHIKTRVNRKDGAVMVYVPAGAFLMGAEDGEGEENEHPQHAVYLDGYWIYKDDVTVGQYRKFCKATGRKMPVAPSSGWNDDHPVVNVTWYEAKSYCAWAGASLPTEAQWEKAARGTDGRMYPWGNDWDRTKAHTKVVGGLFVLVMVLGRIGTTPVGSYPAGASPYGCLDMAGNVWQWCADWEDNDYYAHSPGRNPAGPVTGTAREARGAAWDGSDGYFFRCASRGRSSPGRGGELLGFRCAVRAGG